MLATYVRMAYHMQVNQLCRQHKHVFYCFCQLYHSISFHSISFPVYFISQRRVTHEQTKKRARLPTRWRLPTELLISVGYPELFHAAASAIRLDLIAIRAAAR